MRHLLPAAVLALAIAVPATAAPQSMSSAKAPAQSAAKGSAKAAASSGKAAATHSTMGTVKSVTSTMLVLAPTGKKNSDMSFMLEPSTQQQGTVAVGSTVSVRYRQEGKSYIATAITARAQTPHK